MTTSGQIAQHCHIKCRGGINCLKVCSVVTTRKVSRFGPKMRMLLNESESTRTQGPPGLACKVLHNSWHYTKELHNNPRTDFESYAI